MKVHMRIDDSNKQHTRFTLFVNGANTGQLCMQTEDAVIFHDILSIGCRTSDEFVSSGYVWPCKPDDDV